MTEDKIVGGKNVQEYTQEVLRTTVEAVRLGNLLPKVGENYELYSSFPVFAQFLQLEGQRAIKLINRLYRHAGCKVQISGEDRADEEERMDRMVDANDSLLENIGILLDEASGIRKKPEPMIVTKEVLKPTIRTSWNKQLHQATPSTSSSGLNTSVSPGTESSQDGSQKEGQIRLFGSKNIPRPQVKFAEHVDNSNTPFKPKLRTKHNAVEKWKGNLQVIVDGELVETALDATDAAEVLHPYQYELDHYQPSDKDMKVSTPVDPLDLSETPLKFVSTPQQLKKMCEKLKREQEFAVDLEHHQYRTFLGLTCLMQISTRKEDFIVDTLELWTEMAILNDPFTNPKILKVFHGADKDIEWLQRDFGIYVVNMFDTGQAMRLLNLPRFSLAFLIKYFLNKDLEKKFQLADWRMRPLPDELTKYAREDSHYLLYCCDRLKKDLLDQGNELQNLLRSAFTRSRDICLKHYKKPLFHSDDYKELGLRARKNLNARQDWALKELFAWRDRSARNQDESLRYVLPDHMLLQIADVLPREMQGILACCNPVPPLVRQELHELHRIILQARDKPLTTKTETVGLEGGVTEKEKNPVLHRPQDFSHTQEHEDLMPLSQRLKGVAKIEQKTTGSLLCQTKSTSFVKDEPSLKVFSEDVKDLSRKQGRRKDVSVEEWITPYEQYILAKKYAEEGEQTRKRKVEEESEQPKPKKLYSHKDKAERIPPISVEGTKDVEEMEFPEPKMKKKKKGTMERIEEALEKELERGKKKAEVAKEKAARVKPFDYAAADKNQFFKEKKIEFGDGIFDPHRSSNKSDQKKKGRKGKKGGKGGSRGGLVSKTLSYIKGKQRK